MLFYSSHIIKGIGVFSGAHSYIDIQRWQVESGEIVEVSEKTKRGGEGKGVF